jgi:UDP-glucose 4-epimerase
MKIIVIGAKGFIGSNLARKITSNFGVFPHEDIIEVTNIEDFLSSNWDLLHDSVLIDCVGVKSFYYMYRDTFSRNDSVYSSLISRYTRLIDFCAETNSKFIFISSGGTVYGRYRGKPWEETDLANPVDAYGKACSDVENLITSSNGIIVRGSNIYGALKRNRQGQGIITELLLTYLAKSEIQLFNNGQTIRDYLYIDDFINAICNIVVGINQAPQILNLSSGVGLSQIELIEVFNYCLRSHKMPIFHSQVKLVPDSHDTIKINVLNPQLYISIFGEISNINIKMGINSMIKKMIIDK